MSNMEIETDIRFFLGSYRQPNQDTPGVQGSRALIENDEEPHETYFDAATWSWDDFSSSSKYSSGSSSKMNEGYTPSEGSQTTADDSSVHTPFQPGEDILQLGSTEVHPDLDIDDVRRDNLFAIPTLDKSQTLPRPATLDIPHRVTKPRSRVLKDADKVNQVRGNGACLKCRIQKVSCTVNDICDTCKKAYSQKPLALEACCIRNELSNVAKDYASKRFSDLVQSYEHTINDFLRTRNPQFRDTLFEGQIILDSTKPGIQAILRNYDCTAPDQNSPGHGGCTFSRDHINPALLQDRLIEWAEQCVSPEEDRTFEGAIEVFVKLYVKSGRSTPFRLERPQVKLLESAHTFKSMFKLYKSPTFYFAQSNGKIIELPISAQAQLRGVIRAALESSERNLLSELDRYVKSTKIPPQERPVLWAALWQVLFVYRDLLKYPKPVYNNAEPLFNAVAVFYAACFRTSASLKLTLDSINGHWSPGETRQPQLSEAFEYALSLRDTFYLSVISGNSTVDQRLKQLAVAPEMKVLGRRQTKKSAAGKHASTPDQDGDEFMGDF